METMQAILLLSVIVSSSLGYGHYMTPNYTPVYDQATLNVRATGHERGIRTEQGMASVYGPASPVLLPILNLKKSAVIKRNNIPNTALCSPPLRCAMGFNIKENYKYEKPVLKYTVPITADVPPWVLATDGAQHRPGVKEVKTLGRENRDSLAVTVKSGYSDDETKLQDHLKVAFEMEQKTNETASTQQNMDVRNKSDGSRIVQNYLSKHSKDGEASREKTLSSMNSTRMNDSSPLLASLKVMQHLLVGCREVTRLPGDWEKNFDAALVRMQRCVETRILNGIDRALDAQEVLLGSGLSLVKNNATSDRLAQDSNMLSASDQSESNKKMTGFIETLFYKMAQLMDTHNVKWDTDSEAQSQVEGRRRHQYHKAFPMMVAGYMMMSAFLVPLGFQFMAMIGGKAILLAKMALMMSTFSSFKRVNSPHEYLYHGNTYLPMHILSELATSAESNAHLFTSKRQSSPMQQGKV